MTCTIQMHVQIKALTLLPNLHDPLFKDSAEHTSRGSEILCHYVIGYHYLEITNASY